MKKNFLGFIGFIVALLRVGLGLAGGSSLLVVFGLWSGYTLLEILLNMPRFFLEGEFDPGRPSEEPPGKRISVVWIRPVFMILLSTVLLGIGITAVKVFFQTYMEVTALVPGVVSLAAVMATGILWEGGLLPFVPKTFGKPLLARFHLLFALFVFGALASGYFLSGRFLLIEPAVTFLFSAVFLVRIIGKLLLMAPAIIGEGFSRET